MPATTELIPKLTCATSSTGFQAAGATKHHFVNSFPKTGPPRRSNLPASQPPAPPPNHRPAPLVEIGRPPPEGGARTVTFVHGKATDKLPKERREFFIPKLERERSLYGTEFEIQLRNKLT